MKNAIIYILIGLWILLTINHLGIEKEHEQILKNQEKILAVIETVHPYHKEIKPHMITK